MDWIVGFRHEALTPLFVGLSALGEATFFLVAFTLGYWLLDRRAFLRVSVVLMFAALSNSVLKGVFQASRPDASLRLVEAAGWSFPSAHAMVAGAIWPWLAREARRLWLMPLAILLALAIAASRVYLGVHYPRDVVAGLVVGAGLFLGLWWLADMAPAVWSELSWMQKAALVAVPVVLLVWVLPTPGGGDDTAAKAGGALIGLALGADWERKQVRFVPPRGGWKPAAAVLGLATLFALRMGLAAAFDAAGITSVWTDTLRYTVVGWFVAAGAPWLFVRLGWSEVTDSA